ncbi:hypothetical protein EDC96DRAFT_524940 [Choanephora cucurbitarum]|nr:hypothetical protein EDC96DRAFT_524940 [Choanephora cucurbitarum]
MMPFVLFLLFFITFTNGQDTDTCVSLINSTVCSAFSQFYIGLPGLGNDYPFLLNASTIEEFDRRLLDYVNSTSDYLFPLGCLSSNYNPTIPYARYSLTRLCAGMIQNSAYSLPCNFNNGLTPPPLCKSTCFDWVESITKITDNPHVCSDSVQRNDTLADFSDQCNTWEGFNGTIVQNCISGIANEPYTCGFGNNIRQACHYCQLHSEDKCCQTVEEICQKGSIPGSTIAGIVVGSVVGLALVLLGLVWLYRRRKRSLFSCSANSSTATAVNQNEFKQQVVPINEKTFEEATGQHQQPLATEAPLSSATPFKEEFFVVIHPYPPQMADELALNVGDIICLALHFDDGWALGYNVTTGLKGAFPLVCITPASEESLGQLLNIEDVRDQQQQLQQKPKNTPSPLSTITNQAKDTIPRRSASQKKSPYDYIEAESPSSPTFHTPFFDDQNNSNPDQRKPFP